MTNITSLLNEAVSHHKAGQFADAEKSYLKLIRINPLHADALRFLGGLYFQTGKATEALKYLEQAAKLSPANPEILTNLGSALRVTGRTDEAIEKYKQALAINPDYISALNNLGHIYSYAGKTEEALKFYERVLNLTPQNAEAHFNYGETLEKLGRGQQALEHYRQALKLKPDYIDAMIKMGLMPSLAGDHAQSLRWLDTAQNLLEKRYHADIQNVEAINNLAQLLLQRGRPDEALTYLRQALDLRPDYFSGTLNMASCLRDLNQTEEALHFSRLALQLKPDSADARNMMGVILRDMMRHEDAVEQFDQALKLNPSSLSMQMNKALSLLSLGRYEEGFSLYEVGLIDLPHMRGKNLFTERRWQGESLAGKRLLIWGEQGLGDNLQFIRYAKLCKERSGHIIVLCPKPLRLLFRNCPFIDELPESVNEKDFDFHVPMMSLPYIFNTRIETIPASVPYLYISESARAKWAEKFSDNKIFRIGLVWSGSPREHELKRSPINQWRNIELEKLRPLLDISGIRYHSLQMGAGAAQIDKYNLRNSIIDFTNHINDFEDTAAIIEKLDLVISVDTSVVHLAGGMGKPVWVLSRFNACWRWLNNRPANPWYPTAKVFGQIALGDWDSVVQDIRKHLVGLLHAKT